MATKKRKARGGELWAVIDTTTGKIARAHLVEAPPIEFSAKEARVWVSRIGWLGPACGDRPGRYRVQRILWRPAPARRRAKR